MGVGERIKRERTNAGLSRRALAVGAMVDEQWLFKVETARIGSPSIDKVQRIAAFLRVDLRDLTTGDIDSTHMEMRIPLPVGRRVTEAERKRIERILKVIAKGLLSEDGTK